MVQKDRIPTHASTVKTSVYKHSLMLNLLPLASFTYMYLYEAISDEYGAMMTSQGLFRPARKLQ